MEPKDLRSARRRLQEFGPPHFVTGILLALIVTSVIAVDIYAQHKHQASSEAWKSSPGKAIRSPGTC